MHKDLYTVLLPLGLLGFFASLYLTAYYLLLLNIKRELFSNAPKVDMLLCDKNHLYAKTDALRLTNIPGLEHDVKLCPVCFDANMHNADLILSQKESDAEKTRTTYNATA